MGLEFSPRAPVDGHQKIGEALERYSMSPARGDERANISASDGIETWALSLEDASRGELSGARPVYWRYLVFSGLDSVEEVHVRSRGAASTVSAFVDGPVAERLLAAFSCAENLDEVRVGSYEPRVLVVPGLALIALWLHSGDGDEPVDLYVPLAPSSRVLPPGAPASAKELAQALVGAATQQIALIAAAPGASGGAGPGTAGVAQAAPLVIPTSLRLTSLTLTRRPQPPVATPEPFRAPTPQPSPGPSQRFDRGRAEERQLGFTIESIKAGYSNWCWAAVAASVGRFLKTGTGEWRQCEIASHCLQEHCCEDGSARDCDVYGYLDTALRYTKSLKEPPDEDYARADQIKESIDQGRPICVRIEWFDHGAHFVVITGYRLEAGRMQISIDNPATGRVQIALEDFPAAYGDGGSWTDTYYCEAH